MATIDIGSTIEWFFTQIITIITQSYTILDNITIGNFSLLDFLITILLLNLIIPVILTLLKRRGQD